ncbi:MAG: glycosyltransferase [Methylophilaceae bacterium]
MKSLYVIGPIVMETDHVGYWQIHPFILFKKEFRKAGYDVILKQALTVEDIKNETDQIDQADIIFFRPGWPENKEEVLKLSKSLREKYHDSKLIMIDPWDQTSSFFFESLPYLNAMVKYETLSDKSLYLKDYKTGVYLNDKLIDEVGMSLAEGWSVKSTIKKGQQHKIVSGNFIIDPYIIPKIRSPINNFLLGMRRNNVGLFCHMSVGKRGKLEWYGKHRLLAIEQMKKLSNYNISVEAEYDGEPRISRRQYVKRLKASKVAFSPLGWGEMTMRSFEAIAHRSLLIQPDISHLDIFPNIFVPYETYIPVKLDLSDLAEKCEYYINNKGKRIEIVNNAREAFLREFTSEKFISHMEAIIATPESPQIL